MQFFVNVKLHSSLWEINFVELLLVLEFSIERIMVAHLYTCLVILKASFFHMQFVSHLKKYILRFHSKKAVMHYAVLTLVLLSMDISNVVNCRSRSAGF